MSVRIKPLEWKEARFSDKYQRFTVVTPFGLYEVLEWSDGSFGGSVPSELREDPNVEFSSDTLERAKAAAQADYERRILSALEATPPTPKVTEWREITEDDQPPRDVPVLMGCWEKWPRDEWVVEFGLYGSTKGGWIHGRMTHWLPASILPIAPALTAAQEAGKP